ncbi:MAG: riboflavin synthase, partial [Desulfobacterales bacterium]|nr:riboflavin synthase [Desulfobacterales bacterium]
MFTGIIEGIGEITAIQRLRDDMRLTIAPLFDFTGCRLGDSVAVDGVCLTVNDLSGNIISMDVSGETLSLSTLAIRKEGDKVNLERALRLTDRLGGHLVSGHVDGVGKILKKETQQRSWLLKIGIDERLS